MNLTLDTSHMAHGLHPAARWPVAAAATAAGSGGYRCRCLAVEPRLSPAAQLIAAPITHLGMGTSFASGSHIHTCTSRADGLAARRPLGWRQQRWRAATSPVRHCLCHDLIKLVCVRPSAPQASVRCGASRPPHPAAPRPSSSAVHVVECAGPRSVGRGPPRAPRCCRRRPGCAAAATYAAGASAAGGWAVWGGWQAVACFYARAAVT